MLLKITEIEKINKKSFGLGPWNKNLNYKKYHWNDRSKLDKEYKLIKKIRKRIMSMLVKELNELHKKNYPLKFWEIILEPFVSYFISIYFDRWETVKSLKKDFKYILLFRWIFNLCIKQWS